MYFKEVFYITIKEFEKMLPPERRIIEAHQENNWVVVTLDNDIRFKFRMF